MSSDEEIRNSVMSESIQSFIREQVETVACNTLPDIFKDNESAITQQVLSVINRLDDKEIISAIIRIVQNLKITKADIQVNPSNADETAGDETAGDETAGDETADGETSGGSKKKRRKFNKTKRKKRKNKN